MASAPRRRMGRVRNVALNGVIKFSDPQAYQAGICPAQVELFATAKGNFSAALTAIKLPRTLAAKWARDSSAGGQCGSRKGSPGTVLPKRRGSGINSSQRQGPGVRRNRRLRCRFNAAPSDRRPVSLGNAVDVAERFYFDQLCPCRSRSDQIFSHPISPITAPGGFAIAETASSGRAARRVPG